MTPTTIPHILTRTRDVDTSVRTYLFAVVLLTPKLSRVHRPPLSTNRLNDPRCLTITQREKVVKDGLGDREDKVRVSAGKMLGAWFDLVAEETKVKEGSDDRMTALVAFLKLFDVVGDEGMFVAADALDSIFLTRPRVLDAILFNGTQ